MALQNVEGQFAIQAKSSAAKVGRLEERWDIPALFSSVSASLRWLVLVVPMAAVVGSACAFFLWSLDAATRIRFDHPGLLFLLPMAGFGVGALYHYYGRSAEGGE